MADLRYPWLTEQQQSSVGQYNPPGSNPLPEWQLQPTGGYGYAPNPGPEAGSNNPIPGSDGFTPLADIEAAQAANYAAQQPATTPLPGTPSSSSTPKTTQPAPTVSTPQNHNMSAMQASWTGNVHENGPGGLTWIKAANGTWYPKGHSALNGSTGGASSAAPGTTPGATTPGTAPGQGQDFRSLLLTLANAGGRPNTDALNLRLGNARENLEGTRKSQSDSLMAQLSDMGLLGDGATISGLGGIEQDIAGEYGRAANDIYADEYNRSDNRMMEALALLSGLDTSDKDREVDWFSARSEDSIGKTRNANDYSLGKSANANQAKSIANQLLLGKGNLALGQGQLDVQRELGLGNLSLGQDDLMARIWSQINQGQGSEGYI